jgi:hypothetical protein
LDVAAEGGNRQFSDTDRVRIDGWDGVGRLVLFVRRTDAARFSYRVTAAIDAELGRRSQFLNAAASSVTIRTIASATT